MKKWLFLTLFMLPGIAVAQIVHLSADQGSYRIGQSALLTVLIDVGQVPTEQRLVVESRLEGKLLAPSLETLDVRQYRSGAFGRIGHYSWVVSLKSIDLLAEREINAQIRRVQRNMRQHQEEYEQTTDENRRLLLLQMIADEKEFIAEQQQQLSDLTRTLEVVHFNLNIIE